MSFANKTSSIKRPAGHPGGFRQAVAVAALFFLSGVTGVLSSQEVKINTNLVIESDGTVRMDNSATVWNDLMVYPDATTKGGSNPPEWGTMFMNNGAGSTGVYLWMFAGNKEEELHFTVQLPHDYKIGSVLYPHVHWTTVTGTPSGTNVVWGLEYTVISVGETFAGTTVFKANSILPSIGSPTGTGQHLITELGPISGTNLGISAVIICRLYRASGDAADTFSNNVGLLGFDIHYEQDTQGSRQQWIK
ncbi:MAG: hypothetical protein R6W67_06550 [Bacteroidales bacterium]